MKFIIYRIQSSDTHKKRKHSTKEKNNTPTLGSHGKDMKNINHICSSQLVYMNHTINNIAY
jgi:hypothetical protein